MKNWIAFIVVAAIVGAASSIITSSLLQPSQNDLIKEFYQVENAVHVSPHSIRKSISEGATNFVLVDLRSAEEYEREHIVGAVNIPAYKDQETSDYGAVDRIVSSFEQLPKDKDVIVYCYSTACMTGRKVGKILEEHNIFVKHLGIGWNEWRYDWNGWNHEYEWNITNVTDYIASGKEPGKFALKNAEGPTCTKGALGC